MDILPVIAIPEKKKKEKQRKQEKKIFKEIIQENFQELKVKCTQKSRWKKTHIIAQYHNILEHNR